MMKTVFLCTPHKLGDLNFQLIDRIKKLGFEVLCAATHTPQHLPFEEIFKLNINLIKKADIFIAVMKDYGKDLTAEVGMAYAWNMPSICIDFNANKEDVMSYYTFDKIIKPEELEKTLMEFQPALGKKKLSIIAREANELEDEIGINIDDVLNKLTQELGEFNDAVQKIRGKYTRNKEEGKEHLEIEIGGLVINLISICRRMGVNPDDIPRITEECLMRFYNRKEDYLKNSNG